jgi:hypothetical protein
LLSGIVDGTALNAVSVIARGSVTKATRAGFDRSFAGSVSRANDPTCREGAIKFRITRRRDASSRYVVLPE